MGYVHVHYLVHCKYSLRHRTASTSLLILLSLQGCGKTNTGVEAHWNFYARFCKRCTSNKSVSHLVCLSSTL